MKIFNFEEYLPHIVQELICIECKYRFISVRPKELWLKDMQCPKCENTGCIISTGQDIEDE